MFTTFRKATAGFISAAVATVGAAVVPDSLGGATITEYEWVTVLSSGVIAFLGVYFTAANRPKDGTSK